MKKAPKQKNWGHRQEERRNDSTAEQRSVNRRKEGGIDETVRRSDPKNGKSGPALRTPGTGVEATPESGGERLLLTAKLKCRHFSLTL